MTASIKNGNQSLTFNNVQSNSTSTTFDNQRTKVATDLNNLQRDQQNLDNLKGKGNLTGTQAQDAEQYAQQLKTDAATFQADQQTLLQIAVQDNSGAEANEAVNQAGQQGNGYISQASATAQELESGQALDNALPGGVNDSSINTYHQNINSAVSSANQVGVQDSFTNGSGTFNSGTLTTNFAALARVGRPPSVA